MGTLVLLITLSVNLKRQSNFISKISVSLKRLETKIQKEKHM